MDNRTFVRKKREGGMRCIYRKCKNNSYNPIEGIKFFRIPKDEKRCREWLNLCGREDLLSVDATKCYTIYRVCSIHFKSSMFADSYKRRRLTVTAHPYPFEEDQSTDVEMRETFPAGCSEDSPHDEDILEFKGICTSPSPSEAVPEIPSFADTVDSEIKTEDLNSLTSCCEITEEGIVLETPYPIKDEIIEIRKETTVEKTLEEKYAELLEENEKLRHKAVMLETTNKAQETEIEALEYNLKKLLQDVDELTSYNTKLQQTLLAAQIVIPKEGDY